MRFKLRYGFLTALILMAAMAQADTLQLKNGSVIKGKFLGGTDNRNQLPGRLDGTEI